MGILEQPAVFAFRLPQRILRPFALGDVTSCAVHGDGDAILIEQVTANFDRDAAAVTGNHLGLIRRFSFLNQFSIKMFAHNSQLLGGDEIAKLLPDNLFPAATS